MSLSALETRRAMIAALTPLTPRERSDVEPLLEPNREMARLGVRVGLAGVGLGALVAGYEQWLAPPRPPTYWAMMGAAFVLYVLLGVASMRAGAWWYLRKLRRMLREGRLCVGRVTSVQTEKSMGRLITRVDVELEQRIGRVNVASLDRAPALVPGAPVTVLVLGDRFALVTPEGGVALSRRGAS